MKVYDVEYRAVITLAAQDMQEAALHGVEFIKDNPRLLYVRAVHERNFQMTDAITLYPGTIAQVVYEHHDPARKTLNFFRPRTPKSSPSTCVARLSKV